MKRTLVVLALVVLSTTGCRAFSPGCGDACSDSCCEPCHVTRQKYAPRPIQSDLACGDCGRGGSIEGHCPGGNGCCFDRYRGHNCGPGYHPGPYDCSACDSPHWGCTGHRHPQGYVDGRGCLCNCEQPHPCPPCPACGNGYCCAACGPPGPGGCACCGAPSGDHLYNFNPGPPVAQTAYPYYTLRGPRDFLLDNPPSIGPY